MGVPLKPQDLFASLQLTLPEFEAGDWTYAHLAGRLRVSDAEANAAVRRASAAGLLTAGNGRQSKPRPVRRALLEFIKHGVRYAFYPVVGETTRGMPTAHSAPPLVDKIASEGEPPLVWPDAKGATRGQGMQPLYPTVPDAVRDQPELHELLALVDAIRMGRARERALAIEELNARLSGAKFH